MSPAISPVAPSPTLPLSSRRPSVSFGGFGVRRFLNHTSVGSGTAARATPWSTPSVILGTISLTTMRPLPAIGQKGPRNCMRSTSNWRRSSQLHLLGLLGIDGPAIDSIVRNNRNLRDLLVGIQGGVRDLLNRQTTAWTFYPTFPISSLQGLPQSATELPDVAE